MSEIVPPISTSCPFSPRTANYVSALIREGDAFDYRKWLQKAREEEAQAKPRPPTITSGQIAFPEIESRIGTPTHRNASPSWTLFTRRHAIPAGIHRSHREPLGGTSSTRIRQRLQKVHDAWNDFQRNRARDAVYGYLEEVFAIVAHYKVRRKTKKLLRRAFKFAGLPFDRNANPFTAVIRCTSDGNVDSKTISKWARALRYVASCKVSRTRLRAFMKQAGGINACASLYAQRGRW